MNHFSVRLHNLSKKLQCLCLTWPRSPWSAPQTASGTRRKSPPRLAAIWAWPSHRHPAVEGTVQAQTKIQEEMVGRQNGAQPHDRSKTPGQKRCISIRPVLNNHTMEDTCYLYDMLCCMSYHPQRMSWQGQARAAHCAYYCAQDSYYSIGPHTLLTEQCVCCHSHIRYPGEWIQRQVSKCLSCTHASG